MSIIKNILNSKIKYFYLTAFLLVLLDQATKLAVKGFNFGGLEHQGLNYGELIPIIGSFLQLTFIENPGMAFGIHFGVIGKFFLSLFSILASIGLFYLIYKLKDFHFAVKLGFSLILAGAFGNLIDRVFYGVIFDYGPLFYGLVVDFIQVDIPDINLGFYSMSHWPVFNVADSCVTVGVTILILFYNKIPSFSELFPNKKSNQNKNVEQTPQP